MIWESELGGSSDSPVVLAPFVVPAVWGSNPTSPHYLPSKKKWAMSELVEIQF